MPALEIRNATIIINATTPPNRFEVRTANVAFTLILTNLIADNTTQRNFFSTNHLSVYNITFQNGDPLATLEAAWQGNETGSTVYYRATRVLCPGIPISPEFYCEGTVWRTNGSVTISGNATVFYPINVDGSMTIVTGGSLAVQANVNVGGA